MTPAEIAALALEVEQLNATLDEMTMAVYRLSRHVHARRLALMEARGETDSLPARWERAWLAGDSDEAERVSALMRPARMIQGCIDRVKVSDVPVKRVTLDELGATAVGGTP